MKHKINHIIIHIIKKLILPTLPLKAQRQFSCNYYFKYLLLGTKQGILWDMSACHAVTSTKGTMLQSVIERWELSAWPVSGNFTIVNTMESQAVFVFQH